MRSDVHHFIELLWGMTEKELRARYKYTIFGFLWLVINPVLQMLVIGSIFTFFMKEPIEHYFYHLFVGLLSWNFFSTSLTKATPSIVFERSLIKKAAFPTAVIPLSIVLSNAIHFAIALCLFLIPVTLLGTTTVMTASLMPFGLIMLLIFTVGLSLLTSALNVRYRDVNFFVQAVLIVWFYATPIVYSLSQIPDEITWLWMANPLVSITQILQWGTLGATPPSSAIFFANMVLIFLTCISGIYVFIRESKNFDDWV